MTDYSCVHEHDVVTAVLSRRWHAAPDDLKQHAAECEMCRDVVAVASLLSAEQERVRYEVHVPAAGQIWWRSAIRARLEAAQAVTRPMTWLHGITTACALGLAVAVAGTAWPSVQELAGWLLTQIFGSDSGVGGIVALVAAALQKSLPVAFVLAACIVLAPVALYFALSEEKGR